MRHCCTALVFILVLALTPVSARADQEPPRAVVATFESSSAALSIAAPNPEDGLRLHINKSIDLKQKGFWSITGYKLRIERGVISDPRRAHLGNREVVLLKAQQYLDNRRTDAGGQDTWVALDLSTMEVAGRALNRIEQDQRFAASEGPKVHFKWIYGLTLIDSGEVEIERFRRVRVSREDQEAQSRRSYEAYVAREHDKKARNKEVAERTRPLKSQIGARLCQTKGAIRLVAFTETAGVGNKRIQLRVQEAWEAWKPAAPRLPLTPYLSWEDPDHWEVCN